MPTSSFIREFVITQKETIDKLEKAIDDIKPLQVSKEDVVANMRKNEDKLFLLFNIITRR